jgi:hypothetical protein
MLLELITFKRSGTGTEKAFMDVMAKVDRFCAKQPGFVYRALAYNEETQQWYSSIYWQDKSAVTQADEDFMASGLFEELGPLIEEGSTTMSKAQVKTVLDAGELAEAG